MLIKDEDKFCYVLFDRLFKYLMIMHAPLLVLIFDTQLLTAHDVTNRNPPCQAQKPGFLCRSLPISPSIRRGTRVTAAAAKRGDGVLPGMWAAAADRSGHRRPPPAPLLPRLPLRLPDAEQGPSPYSSSSPPLFLYRLLSVAPMPHIDPCLMWFRFPWRCRRS